MEIEMFWAFSWILLKAVAYKVHELEDIIDKLLNCFCDIIPNGTKTVRRINL